MNISVIINSINRKEFVEEALASVLNQKTIRDQYEIILTKNFDDNDNLRLEGVDKIVNVDYVNQGRVTLSGFDESSGDIVCFLDDDDLFLPNKLENVKRVFSNRPNLVYYHNSYRMTDNDSNVLKESLRPRLKMDFVGKVKTSKELKYVISRGAHVNMSSICVKRQVVENMRSVLSQTNGVNDDILFYSALDLNKEIYLDTNALTLYRFHESNSHQTKDFLNFTEASKNRLTIWKESYEKLAHKISKNFLKETIKCRLCRDQMLFYLLAQNVLLGFLLKEAICHLRCLAKNPGRINLLVGGAILVRVIFGRSSVKILYLIRNRILKI